VEAGAVAAHGGRLPQHYATYVDGNSGAVLARHALVHTEKVTPTTGTANNLFGKQVTLRISHYEDKNRYALFDQSKGLSAATLQTHDAGHTSTSRALATSPARTRLVGRRWRPRTITCSR
jgi:hypothetical protein